MTGEQTARELAELHADVHAALAAVEAEPTDRQDQARQSPAT